MRSRWTVLTVVCLTGTARWGEGATPLQIPRTRGVIGEPATPGGALWWVHSERERPGGAAPVSASPTSGTDRVRALGPAARLLVDEGSLRSPGFAGLLQAIESSDLIVFVATGFLRLPGRLDFVCAKAGHRFLRITVNVPDAEPRLIASLAHELQHAVEIAAAPDVTDAATLARFYERHGQRVSRDESCTRAAQRVADAVRVEVGGRAVR